MVGTPSLSPLEATVDWVRARLLLPEFRKINRKIHWIVEAFREINWIIISKLKNQIDRNHRWKKIVWPASDDERRWNVFMTERRRNYDGWLNHTNERTYVLNSNRTTNTNRNNGPHTRCDDLQERSKLPNSILLRLPNSNLPKVFFTRHTNSKWLLSKIIYIYLK